ncbi:MAG: acyloxyacyl hydrolase [Rhodospirillaceae bacterium]|nr:acyloxyacyl hydrolase [Rhodospirillaceae bacterium]
MRALTVLKAGAMALACWVGIHSAHAADKGQLLVGVGQYDIIPNDNKAVALHVQYRFADGWGGGKALGGKFLGVKPLIGGFVNSDEGGMVFAGFALPFQWGKKGAFEFEPSAAIGAYRRGDSTFLGGTAQFHLGLQFSARVTKSVRAGLGVTHVSNAKILHRKNRGTNILMGTLGYEF